MAVKRSNKPRRKAAAPKRQYKKRTSTAQKASEKAHLETLIAYESNVTKTCLADDLTTTVAGKSSCVENIKVSPHSVAGFQTNWDRNIKDKYEQYRLASLDVRVQFRNTDKPVLFLLDEEAQAAVAPSMIVNDPTHGMKMVKENDNTMVISWRPRAKSSDYDYLPVGAFNLTTTPLGHIKILQHELAAAVGQPGCTMELRAKVACKGLVNAQGSALTAAQQTAIQNAGF